MKIIKRDNLENCFDSDFVVKYTFDSVWTKDAILGLKCLGQLKYYSSFPKPMFQLTCSGGIFVKGVQGLNECNIIYGRDDVEETNKLFEKHFEDSINLL